MDNQGFAKVFRDAAGILESKGWCRGVVEDSQGRHCMLGAIGVALGADWATWDNDAYLTYYHADGKLRDYGYGAQWNDWEAKTASEVIGALLEVAEKLDPQGPLLAETVIEPASEEESALDLVMA